MKKCTLLVVVVLMIAALLGCSGKGAATGAGAAQKVEQMKMRFASCQSPNYLLIEQDIYWVNLVHELLGDQIKIEHFAAGELIKQNEVFDAVSNGTVELGGDFPGYWAGKDSAFNLVASFPMWMTAYDYINWIKFGGGQEEYDRVYGNFGIKSLSHGPITVESGPRSNKPIRSLADYKGLKIRMSGKNQGNILKQLGASQVSIASAEVYQGLQKGLLDAAESCTPMLDFGLGYGEMTKFSSHPGWHQPGSMCNLLINKKIWDSMPEHFRSAFRIAAEATITRTLAFEDYTSAQGMYEFLKMGSKEYRLSDADLMKLAELSYGQIYEESAANPSFAQMAYSMAEYINYYHPWKQWAFPFGQGWKDHPLPDLAKIKPYVPATYKGSGGAPVYENLAAKRGK